MLAESGDRGRFANAQAWAAYQQLGAPDQVQTTIQQATQLRRDLELRSVSDASGYKFGVLKQLANHPNLFRVHYDRPIKTHNYRTSITTGSMPAWRISASVLREVPHDGL